MECEMTNETREAKYVSGVPCGEHGEDGFFAGVGKHFPYHDKTAPVVARITVTTDLPGLHANMERVRVLGENDRLLWEGPLHNLEGVQ
jgi:hypothetical protein